MQSIKTRNQWPQLFSLLKPSILWISSILSSVINCWYCAVVLGTLLYGAETWTINQSQVKKVHSWLHDVPSQGDNEHYLNKVILENAGLPPMTDILIQMNLRWLGHVERMDFARLPRQLLYSQLHDEKRNQGRNRPRFKDIVKRNVEQKKILIGTWRQREKDSSTWRYLTKP